jgi:hypothetical protein
MTNSLEKYVEQFEYIVTLNRFEDLDDFYNEMKNSGRTMTDSVVPEREITIVNLKPTSLNTHFMMTEWEAIELKSDPRVFAVEIHPRYLGITSGTCATITQTSSGWNKSTSVSNTMLNWALLRCTEGEQRSTWGVGGTVSQTGTVDLSTTGKNVDCVIVDAGNPDINNPEYAVNADGTGGSRMVSYNWYQHNPEVTGGATGTYSVGTNSHSVHVSGTVAGNTQGWARDANIYNIYYDTGNPGDFSLVFDYVRAFHRNKAANPALGGGRKNPTITNNSWGQSIFPSEWSFNDVTAVTYRGTRYTPLGSTTYLGYSGVCDSNQRLATLLGFENFGNRITTTGSYTPPSGFLLTKPASWTQTGQEAYLSTVTRPDASYTVTIQGPIDMTIRHVVALNAISGSMSISGSVTVLQGASVINTYSDGPYSTTNGGSIGISINQSSIILSQTAVYTLEFSTTIDTTNASSVAYATDLKATVITTSTSASATVASISSTILGPLSLTSSTTPTVGDNDDGYWTLTLPFNITYLGTSYNTIYVGTNHYITFTAGSTIYSGLGPATPNLPKIMWACGDNSVQRIYYGVEGTGVTRRYRVRLEGTNSIGGTLGSPTMINEWVFYEATPAQIDLQCGENAKKTTGTFTTQQLNTWGFIASQRIPARVTSCDTDIQTAMNEGILFVGAAGNGLWKHDLPGGLDWNNTFEMAARYPASATQPYYYMRGTSPTANDVNMPNICVGAVDANATDQKSYYSDCGPGVDIWAPGTNIISTYLSGASDARNAAYFFGKINGTSMASPQVCGVLACALEVYPNMTQTQAKAYILGIAKANQLTVTNGGPTDIRDTQGAANLFLYYKKERETSGSVTPKLDYQIRPNTGSVYPRTRIRKYG